MKKKEDLEGVSTMKDRTLVEQKKVEDTIQDLYMKILEKEMARNHVRCDINNEQESKDQQNYDETHNEDNDFVDISSDEDEQYIEFGVLDKQSHEKYLRKALYNLKSNIKYYDCGQPWVIFWIIHSIYLLNKTGFSIEDASLKENLLEFIKFSQYPLGGFGGGHFQYPHVASSYAAICSIVEIGTPEAFACVNRQGMYDFLLNCKNPGMKGSFLLCEGGESDMRGVYIAVLIADVLNIMTEELVEGVVDFICSSQTYEGGISPEPHGESHGGLSFCGLAALVILKQSHRINLNRFLYWLTERQMKSEGGFQGRTNKLVDNCYSYWQGATFRLLSEATKGKASYKNQLLFDQLKLQAYILLCQEKTDGGLFDKPGKFPDLYHTCYSLSGLSSAQMGADNKEEILFKDKFQSLTNRINVAYNLPEEKLTLAKEYYAKEPTIKIRGIKQ